MNSDYVRSLARCVQSVKIPAFIDNFAKYLTELIVT